MVVDLLFAICGGCSCQAHCRRDVTNGLASGLGLDDVMLILTTNARPICGAHSTRGDDGESIALPPWEKAPTCKRRCKHNFVTTRIVVKLMRSEELPLKKQSKCTGFGFRLLSVVGGDSLTFLSRQEGSECVHV